MKLIGYGVTTAGGVPVGIWPVSLDQALNARERYVAQQRAPHDVVEVHIGEVVDRKRKPAPPPAPAPQELA